MWGNVVYAFDVRHRSTYVKGVRRPHVTLTPTELRSNLYRILDQVLDTGEPVEIVRRGRVMRIVADAPRFRLDELVPHPDFIVGDPDDLVHLDWSGEWKP